MASSLDYDADKDVGLKKGGWSAEEDRKLIAYIKRYGIWNWNHMAKPAGLSRSGKSCRLRWMNYLRPNLKHGNVTKEEEETIIGLHRQLGNRWAAIAAKLPGRTDNEIKNYWNTHLKKRSKSEEAAAAHSPKNSNIMPAQEASGSSSSNSTAAITEPASSEEYNDPAVPPARLWSDDNETSSENTTESVFDQPGSPQEQHLLIPVSEGTCTTMEEDFQETMSMIMAAGGFYSPYPNLQESLSREYLIYDLWDN